MVDYAYDSFDQLVRQQDPGATPARDQLYLYTADDERITTIDAGSGNVAT